MELPTLSPRLIIAGIALLLISSSFAAGYLFARADTKSPIIINSQLLPAQ